MFGYPGAYVKWDGKTIPPLGAILHWRRVGNDDHEGIETWHPGIVGGASADGTLLVHSNTPSDIQTTEAGGSNNSVNTGIHTPPYLSWGRGLDGYLVPDLLPFPLPSAGELDGTRGVAVGGSGRI